MLRAESYSQRVMLFGHVERASWLAGRFTGTCGEVLTTRGEPSGKPQLLDFKIASRTRCRCPAADELAAPRQYITKLPKAEQAAMECLILVASKNGRP